MFTIAIIDTGINEELFSLPEAEPNIEITEELIVKKRGTYNPFLPSHGTYCAAIIKKFAPDANIASIKITDDKTGKSCKFQLIKALQWCTVNQIRIVNLSMGTANYYDFKDVAAAVEKAASNGMFIIAAYNNFNIYTCPASLSCVIGVKTCAEDKLHGSQSVVDNINGTDCNNYIANSCFSLKDCYGNVKNTLNSNSYATPLITSMVYNVVTKHPDIDYNELNNKLRKNSLKINIDCKDIGCRVRVKQNVNIPMICICNVGYKNSDLLNNSLAKRFCDDGYNALHFSDSEKKGEYNSSVIPLEYYYDMGKNTVSERSLSVIQRIYEADIFIIELNRQDNIKIIDKMPFDVVVLKIDELSDVSKINCSALGKYFLLHQEDGYGTTYLQENSSIDVKVCNSTDDVYKNILQCFTVE